MLFKPLKAPAARPPPVARKTPVRRFAATRRARKPPITQRYGTAQEPAPHLRDQEPQKDAEKEPKAAPEPVEEEEEEELPAVTIPPSQMKSAEAETPGEQPPAPPPDPPKAPDAKPLSATASPEEGRQKAEGARRCLAQF